MKGDTFIRADRSPRKSLSVELERHGPTVRISGERSDGDLNFDGVVNYEEPSTALEYDNRIGTHTVFAHQRCKRCRRWQWTNATWVIQGEIWRG